MQSTRRRTSGLGLGARRPHPVLGIRTYLTSVLVAFVVFVLAWTCSSARASGSSAQQQPQTAEAAAQKTRRVAARRRWLQQRVVYLAWRATSIPYRWAGSSPRTGFDCSGLVSWVYSHVGVGLPHYTCAQWHYGRPVGRRTLQTGDVLFFSGFRHVGIYIGRGRLIHAPRPGTRVQVARLSGWFASSFVGARRLIAL